jgi:hypothetical protein
MPVTENGYQRVGWFDSTSALQRGTLTAGVSVETLAVCHIREDLPLRFDWVLGGKVQQLHQRENTHAAKVRFWIGSLETNLAPLLGDAAARAAHIGLEVGPQFFEHRLPVPHPGCQEPMPLSLVR